MQNWIAGCDEPCVTGRGRIVSLEKSTKRLPIRTICLDCGLASEPLTPEICPHCRGGRLAHHPDLAALSIAHIDCDAFYAAVEKRDNPDLADRPVIIGGGRRGVVSTACYIARLHGVHSAMPMFKALRACPDAVVIKPNMDKYVAVSRLVRQRLTELSPLVEAISIDEAFIDLSGTFELAGRTPAEQLVATASDIERTLGISVSIGLSFNKFLAKIASDADKPRGFTAIGPSDAEDYLADKPVTLIWGVGQALAAKLRSANIRTIADLRRLDERQLAERYGAMGSRLWHLARGRDNRPVRPDRETKSVSSETTFNEDIQAADALRSHLWRLSERVARRLKDKQLAASGVVLKLKTAHFRTLTRSHSLGTPTQMAERLFAAASPLVDGVIAQGPFRLIGIGAQPLSPASEADPPDLLDPKSAQKKAVDDAMQSIRDKLGEAAIIKGRSLRIPSRH